MTETAWRCGWRYQRHRQDQHPFLGYVITVRRGRWKLMLYPEIFDNMTDDEFAALAERAYREAAFDQLQTDLATLARQLMSAHARGEALHAVDGVPYDDVQGALWRWQQTQRDTQEGAT